MGLDEILKSIDEKVKQEVNEVEKEAEEQKERILEEAKKRAQERKKQIIQETKRQIEDEVRRKMIKVRREERKKILTLKSEIMSEVFQEAKDRFLNLEKKEYLSLMRDALVASIKHGDEEVLISPQDKELVDQDFIREIEKAVREKGKAPRLKFTFSLNEKERGFIVKSKDVLVNSTISTLFSVLKDEEEIEVARLLFG
ncbi:hypothetical protein DRJ04_03530 [Candidatus Aerophobetes bacterium]|uniref:V-type proton ATPase subunit E n=1 Tax=Aerophobetes bacterium TaxID=2030807 RepID=A0A662DI42_UNCAE|nr:MAG: hypothetical protein DRJ04_03530 [Candidatus Aerophobetes bacterium]